jgi:UDP-glucose 4-epimerase
MSKTICITGVNGFLGSATAAAFVAAGHRVIGVGTTPVPASAVVPEVVYRALDINDTDSLTTLFREFGVEEVYHLAGIKYVGICENDPERCRLVNHTGTESILAAMKAAQVTHIVFASTYIVYDTTAEVVVVDETSILAPTTVYGQTKLAAEESIVAAQKAGDIETYQILRYGNVIGRALPGSFKVESMIDRIVDAALRETPITLLGTEHKTIDGTIARDFVAVQDVVNAHVLLVDNIQSSIYNIASGVPVTLRQIITAVESVTGKTVAIEVKPANQEPDSVTVVSHKANETFGWRATTPLIDTVRQLVQIAQGTTR